MLRESTHKAHACLLLAGLLLGVAACAEKPVAVVNGKAIDRKTFERHVRERAFEHRQGKIALDEKRLRSAAVNELIIQRLLLDDAAAREIKVSDADASREMESFERSLGSAAFSRYLDDRGHNRETFRQAVRDRMIMARFRELLEEDDPVTEDEMREYYRSSPKPFIRQPSILAGMIQLTSGATARDAIREMREKKIDFDVMAARLKAEGKANVIGYGWVRPEYFSDEVAQALVNLRVGQFGGPYQGKKSFFLIKIKDREKETVAGYDEVRGEIVRTLREQRHQTVFARWLEKKKQNSSIQISLN